MSSLRPGLEFAKCCDVSWKVARVATCVATRIKLSPQLKSSSASLARSHCPKDLIPMLHAAPVARVRPYGDHAVRDPVHGEVNVLARDARVLLAMPDMPPHRNPIQPKAPR